jgi:N-acetylglucosamine-6-phosphate deacetylase
LRALRGKLVTLFHVINDGQVEINDGKITYAGDSRSFNGEITDYGDSIITPGFIDIHIHGLAGYDAMDSDPESIHQISKHLAAKGVTGFLATLQTAPFDEILAGLKRVKQTMKQGTSGAKLLGSHLEGPYISVAKQGAQQEYTRKPIIDELGKILGSASGTLKVVTLAPEIEGGLDAVEFLKTNNVLVSAGHTDASYEEACQAFEAGVSQLSHLWNGMRGIHHREPGIVGAGLKDDSIAVELIADCHHVHPAILRLTVNLKGSGKVALISDSIKPSGLPSGEYFFDGRTFLLEDGFVKLPSGVIAGSSIGLNEAVRNMVKEAGINLIKAVQMATDTPARLLGLQHKGRLESGYDADITIMDGSFNVLETIVEGTTVYRVEDSV